MIARRGGTIIGTSNPIDIHQPFVPIKNIAKRPFTRMASILRCSRHFIALPPSSSQPSAYTDLIVRYCSIAFTSYDREEEAHSDARTASQPPIARIYHMMQALIMVGLLLGAIVSSAVAGFHQAPSDFAIRMEYGRCSTDVLDTFNGVFVRDMGARDPAVSIPVVLSGESMSAIYREVVAAEFFNYPAEFRVHGTSEFGPAMHYRLQVRSGGTTHIVTWTDGTGPSTPEANRLRVLFTTMVKLITDQSDVKRLPVARIACE
jgi:hypothetical protein